MRRRERNILLAVGIALAAALVLAGVLALVATRNDVDAETRRELEDLAGRVRAGELDEVEAAVLNVKIAMDAMNRTGNHSEAYYKAILDEGERLVRRAARHRER